jgi:hypothetical protein
VVAAAVALPVAVAIGLCAPATDAQALNNMDAATKMDKMIEVLFMHSLLVSQKYIANCQAMWTALPPKRLSCYMYCYFLSD